MEPSGCVAVFAEQGNSMKREQSSSLEWECLGLFYKLRLGLKPILLYHSQKILPVGLFSPLWMWMCNPAQVHWNLLSYCPSQLGSEKPNHRKVRDAVTRAQLRAGNSWHSCDWLSSPWDDVPWCPSILCCFGRILSHAENMRVWHQRKTICRGRCMYDPG